MKYISYMFVLALIFTIGAFSAQAKTPIGHVLDIQGSVSIQRNDTDENVDLKVNDLIHLNDTVFTTDGGYAHIEFTDKTSITLNGDGGVFKIDDYIFDPENPQNNKARFDVKRASFIFVSGLIGKSERPDVEIGLDFGTIGIRGTKILRSMKDEECWILLKEGKIKVSNASGSVFLKPDDGTRLSSLKIAPKSPKPWSAEKVAWIEKETALPENKIEEEVPELDAPPPVKDIAKEKPPEAKIESAPDETKQINTQKQKQTEIQKEEGLDPKAEISDEKPRVNLLESAKDLGQDPQIEIEDKTIPGAEQPELFQEKAPAGL